MPKELTISEIGENDLLDYVRKRCQSTACDLFDLRDDCALIEAEDGNCSLLKTDAVCEGIHFLDGEEPRRVGRKAVSRVLSDIGAMGGEAGEFLVTLALCGETPVKWVDELYAGMQERLQQFGGSIVGGETVSVPRGTAKMISISATGRIGKAQVKSRSGAQIGDLIYVTGKLGGSLAGKHLDFDPRLSEGQWLGRQQAVSAMMDLSDGLAADLPRLARCSKVGFQLNRESIPLMEGSTLEEALNDGEDYELLFTVDSQAQKLLQEGWKERFSDLELSSIGVICEEGRGDTLEGGWEHFSS